MKKTLDSIYDTYKIPLFAWDLTAGPTILKNQSDAIAYLKHVEIGLQSAKLSPACHINKACDFGWTPLLAVSYEAGLFSNRGKTVYLDIVRLLLQFPGIDPNMTCPRGTTALHIAARSHNTEMIKLLLDFPGLDVNAVDNYGRTPLHSALKTSVFSRRLVCRCEESVKLLLARPGIWIDHPDFQGVTPRMLAIRNGYFKVSKYLS